MRALVRANLQDYKASDKTNKSYILQKLVNHLERKSPDSMCFVKQDSTTGRWYALTRASARTTVAQAFRDALSHCYRSSRQNKQQRRLIKKGHVAKNASSIGPSACLPLSSNVQQRQCNDGKSYGITLKSAFSSCYEERTNYHARIPFVAEGPLAIIGCNSPVSDPSLPNKSVHEIAQYSCDLVDSSSPGHSYKAAFHQPQGPKDFPTNFPSHFSRSESNFGGSATGSTNPIQDPAEASLQSLMVAPMPPEYDVDDLLLRRQLGEQQHVGSIATSGGTCTPCSREADAFEASERTSAFFLQRGYGEGV